MIFVDFISENLSENNLILAFLAILGSYFITNKSLPFIIYFSKLKKITAKINIRSSHESEVPNIGGIGIIAGIYILTLSLSFFIVDYNEAKFLIALFIPLLTLLFMGFKDDLLGLSPTYKLLSEIFSATIFIILTDCRLDNFYGLFGVYEISYILSIFISVFIFIIIINSYNLIDGIDGLASGYGILAVFGCLLLSLLALNKISIILSASIIGSLSAFFRFNISSGKRKIFMGDTGSLVIGFLISVIVLIILNSKNNFNEVFSNIPVLVLAILSFPFIDTLRVMYIRKKNRKKFFEPDKNHIHHELLRNGYSHKKSSAIIIIITTIVILFCILFSELDITIHFFISLFFSILSFLGLVYYMKKKISNDK